MDLATEFAVPLPIMVIAEMLGIPAADQARFRRWSEGILNLSNTVVGGKEATHAVAAYAAAKAEMIAYLAEILPRRRAAPGQDLLSQLVDAEVDGERLSEADLLGFFQLLLLAGSETTTNLINNAILCLIEHPAENRRLREAADLLPNAIEEVLRYRAPVQVVFRTTTQAVELHGRVIPAGKLVLVVIGSANRDPQVFAAADRFEITRDPNPHLAFGHGIHFCLGAALARLEARIALTELLRRLQGITLAGAAPWVPRRAFHVHGPARLPIRFAPLRSTTLQDL